MIQHLEPGCTNGTMIWWKMQILLSNYRFVYRHFQQQWMLPSGFYQNRTHLRLNLVLLLKRFMGIKQNCFQRISPDLGFIANYILEMDKANGDSQKNWLIERRC